MTRTEIAVIENAARSAMAWAPEESEGETHVRALLMALLPAAAILFAAAIVLSRLLAA